MSRANLLYASVFGVLPSIMPVTALPQPWADAIVLAFQVNDTAKVETKQVVIGFSVFEQNHQDQRALAAAVANGRDPMR